MIYIRPTGCSSEIQFAVNSGRLVDSGINLTVGDVLTCSAQDALSYRWTNVLTRSDVTIYEKILEISRPGSFNYECTVFKDCGTGVICQFTRNIIGQARGIIYICCLKHSKHNYLLHPSNTNSFGQD